MKKLFKNNEETYYPITKPFDKLWKWLCTKNFYRSVILKRARKFFKHRENTTDSAVARSILKLVLRRETISSRVSKFTGRFNFYGWWTDCQMGDVGTHGHHWPISEYQKMAAKAKYFSIQIYLSKEEEWDDQIVGLKITSPLMKIDSTVDHTEILEFKYSWGDNINWVWRLYFDNGNRTDGKVEIYFD